MNRLNPWVIALIAWLLAAGLVVAVYTGWQISRGGSVAWDLVRDAALMTLPLALVMAWRDRGRKR